MRSYESDSLYIGQNIRVIDPETMIEYSGQIIGISFENIDGYREVERIDIRDLEDSAVKHSVFPRGALSEDYDFCREMGSHVIDCEFHHITI